MKDQTAHGGAGASGTGAAFAAVATLFFAWGFITSLVDPLVASVKGIFTLSNAEAQFSAFAFFFAYGLISFPAATLLSYMRPVRAILLALATMALACLVMLLAANLAVYPVVLLGLFGLASGITMLQVAANPLAAALGDPARSHFRLTVSQTFNSLGTFLGPLLGAHLFLAGIEVKHGSTASALARRDALAGIDTAYLWICGLIAALMAFFWLYRRTVTDAVPAKGSPGARGIVSLASEAVGSHWARLGALAIFLYVGAEVSIGTQMALFLNSDAVWGHSDIPGKLPLLGRMMGADHSAGVSLQEAGKAVALYWGGAMIGRAVGSVLLRRIEASRLLAVFTAVAACMCLYVALVGGVLAGFVALAIGLFNSIMFPVIFGLTLERASASEEAVSGLLCTAIVGGAFVPLAMGKLVDMGGYGIAFLVPAICYVILFVFARQAGRQKVRRAAAVGVH